MSKAAAAFPLRSTADSAGLLASILCAIHCAAMPLVIGYLPLLGLSWLADESFHQVMAVLCFGLAVAAFMPGWRKHGSLVPALVGSAGVLLLATAAFGLEGECCPSCASVGEAEPAAAACTEESCPHCPAPQPAVRDVQQSEEPIVQTAGWALPFITPAGGLLLVTGHLVNHRKACRCRGDGCCLPSPEGDEA